MNGSNDTYLSAPIVREGRRWRTIPLVVTSYCDQHAAEEKKVGLNRELNPGHVHLGHIIVAG